VLAESFERIHRSNLVGMGVLPMEFLAGENLNSLGLTGLEMFDIEGLAQTFEPRKKMKVRAHKADGKEISFTAVARVDTPFEVAYYQHGVILQYVLRQIL
jgi:aconitate hydratase